MRTVRIDTDAGINIDHHCTAIFENGIRMYGKGELRLQVAQTWSSPSTGQHKRLFSFGKQNQIILGLFCFKSLIGIDIATLNHFLHQCKAGLQCLSKIAFPGIELLHSRILILLLIHGIQSLCQNDGL